MPYSKTCEFYNVLWRFFRKHAHKKDIARIIACRLKGLKFDQIMLWHGGSTLLWYITFGCVGCGHHCDTKIGAREVMTSNILLQIQQGHFYSRRYEGLKGRSADVVVMDEFAKVDTGYDK